MATRSMPFWPRPATTSGSSWPGSGLCAPFSGRLSWSGMTRAAPPPHPPEHANSLFHRRPDRQNQPADLIGHATVIDGDTIVIGVAHLRLVGIDTPESDQ